MSNQANFVKGYYSILQYVPDPERAEGVNVGIVLLCPEKGFLKAISSKDNHRVRRLFRAQDLPDLDLKRLTVFKEAFAERVASEATSIHSLEDFQRFIDTRANQLRLTTPRAVKIQDPEAELTKLFAMLVEEPSPRHIPRSAAQTKAHFSELIKARGLSSVVQEDKPLQLPLLGETIVYPFAFRNGQQNVIAPVSFESDDETYVKNRTCRLVVEGQDLRRLDDPTKLNVIGSFKPTQTSRMTQIKALLEANDVTLHTADEMEQFVEEIAATAHA